MLTASFVASSDTAASVTRAQVRRVASASLMSYTSAAPAPDDVAAVDGAQWGRFYNGPANCCEMNPLVAVDGSGNVLIAGQSTTTRDSPGGPFNDDIATVKYDSQGNQLWARRFDAPGASTDTPQDIQIDAQGNVVVAGHGVVAGGDMQFVTLKYDAGGQLLW
ncbi:MAG TPA: hypothetical protein VF754_09890, partial [Pyrinomonadaceae bacterium]